MTTPPRLSRRARIAWAAAAVIGVALAVICVPPAQALWDMSFDTPDQGLFDGRCVLRWSAAATPCLAGLFGLLAMLAGWRGRGWRAAALAGVLTLLAFGTAAWIVAPVLFGFGSGSADA